MTSGCHSSKKHRPLFCRIIRECLIDIYHCLTGGLPLKAARCIVYMRIGARFTVTVKWHLTFSCWLFKNHCWPPTAWQPFDWQCFTSPVTFMMLFFWCFWMLERCYSCDVTLCDVTLSKVTSVMLLFWCSPKDTTNILALLALRIVTM